MNHKEESTGKIYKNWDDITEKVRIGLNKIRKVKLGKFDINDYPFFINYNIPKFKIGQVVHYKLDTPENALGFKQPTWSKKDTALVQERLLKFCILMMNLI